MGIKNRLSFCLEGRMVGPESGFIVLAKNGQQGACEEEKRITYLCKGGQPKQHARPDSGRQKTQDIRSKRLAYVFSGIMQWRFALLT
jgi:hypothetical protein